MKAKMKKCHGFSTCKAVFASLLCTALYVTTAGRVAVAQMSNQLPSHIPPRRSSQLQEAPAGVNTSLPRLPYLPWTERWWTRIYDGGFKYVRIGQYEDTSDMTGWDWIEHKKGVLEIKPEVDEYVDSLIANGATIELQLLYGNPIYTSQAGVLPTGIVPTPASVHNPDFGLYSIFWPPTTPDQIAAFLRYTRWMVNHFRGRIQYYSLWNEEDGSYWNPRPNPQEYGRLLGLFAKTVRQTDPNAKIVFGGQATLDPEFARGALEACDCASEIDVFAYHTYPGGIGSNTAPEEMDDAALQHGHTTVNLRDVVSSYPKIRPGIQFWDDEYNSIPSAPQMNEAIQAKYAPRAIVYNWAAGVPTFLWELINDTNTSEGDKFGIIHGMMHKASDFQPRPVFYTIERTNALLGDTHRDPSIKMKVLDSHPLDAISGAPLLSYGFRSRSGKSIVTYWLAISSIPGKPFQPVSIDVSLRGTGIEHPVLIDLDADKILPLTWENSGAERRLRIPVKDSVMAVADANYFDWAVLPDAPYGLRLVAQGSSIVLTWHANDGIAMSVLVERRLSRTGKWVEIAHLPVAETSYKDVRSSKHVSYRIRSMDRSGKSGYSNVVGLDLP
ncbi:MAG: hypothetical protein WCE63_12145 [Acidobacteriaceae bacterium]